MIKDDDLLCSYYNKENGICERLYGYCSLYDCDKKIAHKLKKENRKLEELLDAETQSHIDNICRENVKLTNEINEIKKYLGISNKSIMQRLEELQNFRDEDKAKIFDLEQKLKDIRSSIPMIVDGSADIFNEIIAIINRK